MFCLKPKLHPGDHRKIARKHLLVWEEEDIFIAHRTPTDLDDDRVLVYQIKKETTEKERSYEVLERTSRLYWYS